MKDERPEKETNKGTGSNMGEKEKGKLDKWGQIPLFPVSFSTNQPTDHVIRIIVHFSKFYMKCAKKYNELERKEKAKTNDCYIEIQMKKLKTLFITF